MIFDVMAGSAEMTPSSLSRSVSSSCSTSKSLILLASRVGMLSMCLLRQNVCFVLSIDMF
jgi:hypothetical protein